MQGRDKERYKTEREESGGGDKDRKRRERERRVGRGGGETRIERGEIRSEKRNKIMKTEKNRYNNRECGGSLR